ncbi:hypothetical protein DSECCO2_373650 [anaerobic digester metagenome]
MKHYEVLIVGGGAAGCIAALSLKEAGVDAAIAEGSDRLLKKLLVTGNGRCNITNQKLIEPENASAVSPYFTCHDPSFGFDPLLAYDAGRIIGLFGELGLPLTTLEEGKMYPKSLQASSVSDLIRLRLEELGVPVWLNCRVKSISRSNHGFSVVTPTESFTARSVLIATGGQAMPATGSDGSGYKLARSLGHTVIPPLPALVQLKTDFPQARALAGVKTECRLDLWTEGRLAAAEAGELLFTEYGVSGPPILQLSRFASDALAKGQEVILAINLFPELSAEKVRELIEHQRQLFPHREAQTLFNGILHKKLIPVLLRLAGLDKMNRSAREVDQAVYDALTGLLTDWRMRVSDTNGFANSQSTLGGVDLREVHPASLSSKKVSGLYFAGEILDVCGACGGYNLQWAWSSALAAASAIRRDLGK